MNADGAIGISFNTGTGVHLGIIVILIQNDGKIILAGDFYKLNEAHHGSIVRINGDGSADTTFNSGIGFNNESNEAVLQPDGKFSSRHGSELQRHRDEIYHTTEQQRNHRFCFQQHIALITVSPAPISAIVLQKDGKIIIAGSFTGYSTTSCNRIMRLNAGTGFNESASPITVQDDRKTLVGGEFTSFNGKSRGHIARLNSDGSVDTAFVTGAGTDDFVCAIAVGDNNRIFTGGFYSFAHVGWIKHSTICEDMVADAVLSVYRVGGAVNMPEGRVLNPPLRHIAVIHYRRCHRFRSRNTSPR